MRWAGKPRGSVRDKDANYNTGGEQIQGGGGGGGTTTPQQLHFSLTHFGYGPVAACSFVQAFVNEGGYGTRAGTVLIHFRGFVKSLFCREMCCSTKSAAATGRDMALDILPEAQVRAKRER